MCTTDGGQKAASAPNFARNSLLLTLYQLSEIEEFQRSNFKRRNNRPGITCNIFAEPSAARTKRCIKTAKSSSLDHRRSRVRKHRAPKGALRPNLTLLSGVKASSQKAPSAIRCIKTEDPRSMVGSPVRTGQKAPSAIRCIKTGPRTGTPQK